MSRPKGELSKGDVKKIAKKDRKKELLEMERVRDFQRHCNHINRKNGKNGLNDKKNRNSGKLRKCSVCNARVNTDLNVINKETIADAVDILFSAQSIIRNQFNIKPKMRDKIITMMEMADSMPGMFGEMQEQLKKKAKKKNKKKNNGKGKNNKGKNKRKRRVIY